VSKTALIAVGGNSLIRAGEKGTIAEQLAMFARAKAAGGQLDVSSKPGQGTSISVRFPDHPQPA